MHHTGTLVDRQKLEQLAWTLGRCLDERDFDGLRQIFTADATVTTRETASGHDGSPPCRPTSQPRMCLEAAVIVTNGPGSGPAGSVTATAVPR